MKVLILGGDGMLGHQALKFFENKYETKVTLTGEYDCYDSRRYTFKNSFFDVNALNLKSIEHTILNFQPDYVINGIGIIKQHYESKDYTSRCIEINSLFPHKLAKICGKYNARLFHISTDCVFDGKKGDYKETDLSDADDIYGKTKFLGELSTYNNALTLRTSIIGKEIKNHKSLVDWFFAQEGKKVNGYTNSIYTGLTCHELCNVMDMMMTTYPTASGLYQVSSDKIVKSRLLEIIRDRYNLNIEITPYEDFYCDRSLDSSLFRRTFCYEPPTWEEMIENL